MEAGRGKSQGGLGPFADLPQDLVLVGDSLGALLGVSHIHPGIAKIATNCGQLCSSKPVAQGQSQAVSDIDLHQSPSQEALEPIHSVNSFRQHQNRV